MAGYKSFPIIGEPLHDIGRIYDAAIDLFRSYKERWRVAFDACDNWPYHNFVWDAGDIVSAVSDGSTITVTVTMDTEPLVVDGVKRYVHFGASGTVGRTYNGHPVNDFAPDEYWAVLDVDNPDESLVLKAYIDNTPNGTTITFPDDGSYDLNRSLSELAGTRMEIMGKGTGCLSTIQVPGLSSADRILPRPNVNRDTGSASATATTYIEDTTKTRWPLSLHGPFDLITHVGGKWKRIAITSMGGATDTVGPRAYFATQPAAPDSGYYIVSRGAYWTPRMASLKCNPFLFYNGLFDPLYWTVYPNGALDTIASIAATSFTPDAMIAAAQACFGIDVVFDAGMTDIYADTILAGEIWWNLPQLWHGLFKDLAPQYTVGYGFDNDSGTLGTLNGGNPAALIRAADEAATRNGLTDLNFYWFTAQIDSVDTVNYIVTFSRIGLPDDARERDDCYWMLTDSRGFTIADGAGIINTPAITGATTLTHSYFNGATNVVDKVLVMSFGGDRKYVRRIINVYPRTHHVPDIEDDPMSGNYGNAVDPPTATHPGTYSRREPATHYAEYDALGQLVEGATTFLGEIGPRKVVVGEIVRYVGNSKRDPKFPDDVAGDDAPGFPDPDPLTLYGMADHISYGASEVFLPPSNGTIASVDVGGHSITVVETLWKSETPRITHTGTITSATASSITSSGSTNGFYFSAPATPTRRFVGHTLVIDTINIIRVDVSGGDATFTFSAAVTMTGTVNELEAEDPGSPGNWLAPDSTAQVAPDQIRASYAVTLDVDNRWRITSAPLSIAEYAQIVLPESGDSGVSYPALPRLTKRLVSTQTGTTGTGATFGFTPALSFDPAGLSWSIREPPGNGLSRTGPAALNFWEGVPITSNSGSRTVRGHDDHTIFLDGTPVDFIGTWALRYENVLDRPLMPGDSVVWDGSEYIVPGTGATTGAFGTRTPATVVQNYGLPHRGDIVTVRNLNQLFVCLDMLRKRARSVTWNANGEINTKATDRILSSPTCQTNKDDLDTRWVSEEPFNMNNGNAEIPQSYAKLGDDEMVSSNLYYAWNYLTLSAFQCARFGLNSRIFDAWLCGGIDTGDSAPGTQYSFDSSGPLAYHRWTKVISSTTTNPDVQLLIGSKSIPHPPYPSCPPEMSGDFRWKGWAVINTLGLSDYTPSFKFKWLNL